MGTEIHCPNCHTKIVIEEAIAADLQKEMRSKMEAEWRKRLEGLQVEKQQLAQEKEVLENRKLQQEALFAEKIREARKEIESEAVRKAQEESLAKIRSLEEERIQKNQQLQELKARELDLLREKTELESQRKNFELDLEKKLLEGQREIEEQASRKERELSDLKLKDLQKKLDVQTRLAEEMQRKAEQGSMQLQGEVLELALESLLKSSFPFDDIREIAKGKRGADCVLVVRNQFGQECGKIVYESKRTQDFAKDWIEKVKADARMINADLSVIVTQALPKDMDDRFGHMEGVWICEFRDVKSLTAALRDGLIKVHMASKSQENKGDKMQMLYGYLTSNEFSMQWGAIREGFRSMQQSIQKEREIMEKMWKGREKQLEKVLLNAAHIKGAVEGIAGTDSVDLNLLENEDEGKRLY